MEINSQIGLTQRTAYGKRASEGSAQRNFVAELRAMKAAGLTFGDCLAVFGDDPQDPFVLAAREFHHKDGEIEIDDITVVSRGDDPGAYVMAWLWIDQANVGAIAGQSKNAEIELIYQVSEQPFTCVACGARTRQEGEKDAEGRWVEVCLACGKRHLVEDGEEDGPVNFRNFYACPNCKHEWEDVWSSTCDDACPQCGARHISPVRSEDVA